MNALDDALLRAASPQAVFLAALIEKFIPILPSYVLYPAIGIGAEDAWALAAPAGHGGPAGWRIGLVRTGRPGGAKADAALVERHYPQGGGSGGIELP